MSHDGRRVTLHLRTVGLPDQVTVRGAKRGKVTSLLELCSDSHGRTMKRWRRRVPVFVFAGRVRAGLLRPQLFPVRAEGGECDLVMMVKHRKQPLSITRNCGRRMGVLGMGVG